MLAPANLCQLALQDGKAVGNALFLIKETMGKHVELYFKHPQRSILFHTLFKMHLYVAGTIATHPRYIKAITRAEAKVPRLFPQSVALTLAFNPKFIAEEEPDASWSTYFGKTITDFVEERKQAAEAFIETLRNQAEHDFACHGCCIDEHEVEFKGETFQEHLSLADGFVPRQSDECPHKSGVVPQVEAWTRAFEPEVVVKPQVGSPVPFGPARSFGPKGDESENPPPVGEVVSLPDAGSSTRIAPPPGLEPLIQEASDLLPSDVVKESEPQIDRSMFHFHGHESDKCSSKASSVPPKGPESSCSSDTHARHEPPCKRENRDPVRRSLDIDAQYPINREVELPGDVVDALQGLTPPLWSEDEYALGRPLFGEEVPEDQWVGKAVNAMTTITVTDPTRWHPMVEHEMTKAQNAERIRCAADPSVRSQCVTDGTYRPQGLEMLAGDPDAPVHLSCPSANNQRAALVNRHLPDTVPEIAAETLDNFFPIAINIFIEELRLGLSGKDLSKKFDMEEALKKGDDNAYNMSSAYFADFQERSSKKWADPRAHRAFITACMYTSVKVLVSKGSRKGMQPAARTYNTKKNEGLTKLKPRGIMAGGDVWTCIHTSTAGLLEYLMFHIPSFAGRSVKHATKPELAARYAKTMATHLLWWAQSDDYGAFDSSVKQKIRAAGEQAVLAWVSELFSNELSKASRADIEEQRKILRGLGFQVETEDCCRESGFRGTSVCNFITSMLIEAYSLFKCLTARGFSPAAGFEEVRMFFRGVSKYSHQTGEGDDSWKLHSPELVRMAAGAAEGAEITAEVREKALNQWVAYSLDLGFKLEPQTAAGRVTTSEGYQPVLGGRHEFVSTVMSSYCKWGKKKEGVTMEQRVARGNIRVRLIPKPRKTLDSLCVTFNVEPGTSEELKKQAWNCLGDKALAAMSNNMDVPSAFRLYSAIYRKTMEMGRVESDDRMSASVGWNFCEMQNRYGDATNTYYDALVREHETSTKDIYGARLADITYQRELEGSCPVGRKSWIRSSQRLECFVASVERCAPSDLPAVWASWRRHV